jgi:hypothetical protein
VPLIAVDVGVLTVAARLVPFEDVARFAFEELF